MRQHGGIGSHNLISREAATGIEHQAFLSSLRDFAIILFIFPWAYTHGYILPPLRG